MTDEQQVTTDEPDNRTQAQRDRDEANHLLDVRAIEAGIERVELVRLLAEAEAAVPMRACVLLKLDKWRTVLDEARAEIRRGWEAKVDGKFLESVKGIMPAAATLAPERRRALLAPQLRTWAAEHDPAQGALLLGLSGIGKTLACVELAHRVHTEEVEAAWESQVRRRVTMLHPPSPRVWTLRAASLASTIEYGMVKPLIAVLNKAWSEPVVVLDDLGWEPPGVAPAIRDLLAHRYSEGLPTICTSGETLPALRERYGDALIRRVVEARGERGPVIDLHPKAKGAKA